MKTDSVLAELTPREAVLNRNAAELMGRKKIAALNAKGNKLAKRGVDLPSRKYQSGTSNVEADKRPPVGPKSKAGLYEPPPYTPKEQEHDDPEEARIAKLREDWTKTIGLEINGRLYEVPADVPGLTEAEANLVSDTPQGAWPKSVLGKIENYARYQLEQGRHPLQQPTPVFQFQSGTSDVGNERRDLLKEAEETFYGGGHAPPKPTPTPTPKPRKYQYGTSNVRRAVDMSAPVGFAATPGAGAGFNAGSTINTNPSAFSRGVSYPFSSPVPDLSRANPNVLNRLDISNLIYSPNAGGYLTRSEAENANSWYTKFGQGSGGDPLANRSAARFYGYIGSLPTRAMGTPALNQYYNQFGGGSAPAGPSFNSILGSQWQGPYQSGVRSPSSYNPGGWSGSDF